MRLYIALRFGVIFQHPALAFIHNARGIITETTRGIVTAARRSGMPCGIAERVRSGAYPPLVGSRKSKVAGSRRVGESESRGVAGSRRVGVGVARRESPKVGESHGSRSAVKVEKPLRADLRRHFP